MKPHIMITIMSQKSKKKKNLFMWQKLEVESWMLFLSPSPKQAAAEV